MSVCVTYGHMFLLINERALFSKFDKTQYITDEEGREEMHFLPINVFNVITHSYDIEYMTSHFVLISKTKLLKLFYIITEHTRHA